MPPSPPILEHTLNTRGELGLFVNPYTCDCRTCKDYLSRPAPPPSVDPDALRALVNSPSMSWIGPTESVPTELTTIPPAIPEAPALRRVNAFTDSLGRRTVVSYFTGLTRVSSIIAQEEAIEVDALSKLQSLHRLLLLKQEQQKDTDGLVAAADLAKKIAAIEATLEAFGAE